MAKLKTFVKNKITIQLQNTNILHDDQVMLGEAYMKQWRIPENQPLTLRYGSSRNTVKVISTPRSDGLRIHSALAGKLSLHQGVQLRMHYRAGSQTLSLGPLIGIMVSREYHGASSDKLFGAITPYCKEVAEACRMQGAFVFFFTPNDIHANHQSVGGWSYNGRWSKSSFPVPNVVHNRLTSRKLENRPSVQLFMKEAKSRYHTSIFNEQYLNKTEVFQALRKDTSLHHYLPESHLFNHYQMLKTMCSKYSVIFLKPVNGSLGQGILRISKQAAGYSCEFTNLSGAGRKSFSSLPKLFSAISGKMRARRYQIQQGLRLISIDRRPVDFRALVQKDKTGNWSITSIVGRIAANHHFVSNLAKGGSLSSVRDALIKSNLGAQQRQSAYLGLRRSAIAIANGIDAQIPSHFGELGVDLAVDTRGKVWLIEVNSKPSKNDETPQPDHQIRPSVKQMVQYARYIAGF
ncbi:MAG TPA: YheC/YheD family protein [Bacilli bacterium]